MTHLNSNSVPPGETDLAWLQHELDEAHKTVRTLLRQLSKEQQRHADRKSVV